MLVVKNLPASAGDVRDAGSIPGLGRSPGGGHGSPLHIPAWRIPWTEELGGLQSMGLHSRTWLDDCAAAEYSLYSQPTPPHPGTEDAGLNSEGLSNLTHRAAQTVKVWF